MRRRLYDSWRKCVCGHIIAHHRLDSMQACRMDDCDCEGFMPRKIGSDEGRDLDAVPAGASL